MAFTVEDGTGVLGANAYCDVAWADAWFADRGETGWTGTDAVKEQAIVKATDYIETRYSERFKGVREFSDDQPLSFPRLYLYDREGILVTGIPDRLKQATALYALRALSAVLLPDPVADEAGRLATVTRDKVGPIETERQYASAVAQVSLSRYPAADNLLKPYLLNLGVHR